jgi:hypothetical protein
VEADLSERASITLWFWWLPAQAETKLSAIKSATSALRMEMREHG